MQIQTEQILARSSEGSGFIGGSGNESESTSSTVHSGFDPKREYTATEQQQLFRDPLYFCSAFCASNPYTQWQQNFLRDLKVVDAEGNIPLDGFPRNIALGAVNGSGKTEILAHAIRYLLTTVPNCVIPITSKVYRQLEMLEAHLGSEKQLQSFPESEGWKLVQGKLTAPNGNFARWFATKDVGSVESFHAPFLVRIVDEVKSMDDPVIDATNRWHPKLTIFVSSKGLLKGRFYECFTKNRERWHIHEAGAKDCPWFLKNWIDEQVAEHGLQSGLIKSMITNEFSDVDIRNLMNLEMIMRCVNYPPIFQHNNKKVAGVDPSAAKQGGDEFVIAPRLGNRILDLHIIRGFSNPLAAVGESIRILKEMDVQTVYMDHGNIGQLIYPMYVEQLKGDKSIQVIPVNFGGSPLASNGLELYADRATEMWANGARQFEKNLLGLPNDPKLISQLTTREIEPRMDGKLKLISKPLMKKKGLGSPDRADAVMLAAQHYYPERRNDMTGWRRADADAMEFDDNRRNIGTTADGAYDLGNY
jgi:phage terminase large subunit